MKNKLSLVLMICLLGCLQCALAQTTTAEYEAVYTLEEPKSVLVLKKKGNGYHGYIVNEESARKISGEFKDEVLLLTLAEGNDKTVSYAGLDETGNLLITDENLNMAYFIRSEVSVGDMLAEIEKARPDESAGDVQSTAKPAKEPAKNTVAVKGKVLAKYANKKFLHMYTGNGLSEKWAYYLYDDGRFYYRNFTSYMSSDSYSNFSAVMDSDDAGRWAVEVINGAEYLNLYWNSGKTGQMKIQKAEIGYIMNNNKYYLVDHREAE